MALLTWTAEQFGTNVSEADQQHQTLFNMLNELHETVSSGERGAIGNQLDALIDYVVMHFQTEEKLMQANGYPNYAAHKAEHDKLVSTCADLQKKFHAGDADVTEETTTFVKDWLVNHIPKIDKDYGPFLNEKGVS